MGIFNDNIHNPHSSGSTQGPVGPKGPPGPGFKFTRDGNFNVEGKRLTNVGAPTEDDDTTTKKYVDDGMSGKVSTDMVMTLGRPEGEKIVRYLPNPGGEEKNVGLITHKLYIEDEFNDSVILQADYQDFDDVHLYIPNLKNYDNSGGRRKSNLVVNSVDNNITGKIILPSGNLIVKDGNNQTALYRADLDKLYGSVSGADGITYNKVALYSSDLRLYALTYAIKNDNDNDFVILRCRNSSGWRSLFIPSLNSDADIIINQTDQTINGNKTFSSAITMTQEGSANNHVVTKKYVDDEIAKIPSGSGRSYFLKKDGSVPMTGDLNMNEQRVKNTLDPTDEQDTVNKRYLESQLTDYLKRNGQNAMTFDLNMDNYKIVNLNEPTLNSDATTKKYVDNKTLINPSHSLTNSFEYLMNDINEISTEYGLIADKIDNLSWSPHENKKVLYFKALKDGLNYRYRLGFQMTQASPIANTIAIEQLFNNENYWNKAEISINGTGITIESSHTNKFHYEVGASNYYYTKTIIQLKRLTAPEHQLYYTTHIDNVTSSPIQLQQYILAYGVNSFMSDVDSIVYNLPLFKRINDKMQMQVNLDMNNKKIENLAKPTDLNDAVNFGYLLGKKEIIDLFSKIAFPPVSALDSIPSNLIHAYLPLSNSTFFDVDDKIGAMINLDLGLLQPEHILGQLDKSKQPLLMYNKKLRKFYAYFSSNLKNLKLQSINLTNEFTMFIVIKTDNIKDQAHFHFTDDLGNNLNNTFRISLPGLNGDIVIINSLSQNERDLIEISGQSNIIGNIELWTIRVTNGSNQRKIEIFRGLSLTPIKTQNLNYKIKNNQSLFLTSEMEFYEFLFYNRSLTDLFLKKMFKYHEDEFQI